MENKDEKILFKIDLIIDKIYNETKKKYKKILEDKETFEVKIVIPALENHKDTFVKDHFDITVNPNESTVIEKYGCKFHIFSDFYNDKEQGVAYWMYHNFFMNQTVKKQNSTKIYKFSINYRLLK